MNLKNTVAGKIRIAEDETRFNLLLQKNGAKGFFYLESNYMKP